MKEGDVVTLPRRRGGPVELTIIGVGQDYTWSKGTIFMDRKRYVELFEDDFVDIYHVYFKPDADKKRYPAGRGRSGRAVETGRRGQGFVREFLAGVIDKIYRLAYLQQVIVAVVAALGRRDGLAHFGLAAPPRTRPAARRRRHPAAGAEDRAGRGVPDGDHRHRLGIALGLPMEWYLRVVLFEESGFWFDMIVPWKEAFGIAAVAIGVATIAGLIPALHAVPLRIVDAIAYDEVPRGFHGVAKPQLEDEKPRITRTMAQTVDEQRAKEPAEPQIRTLDHGFHG